VDWRVPRLLTARAPHLDVFQPQGIVDVLARELEALPVLRKLQGLLLFSPHAKRRRAGGSGAS
jgi:hypothetical protein